MDTFVAAAIGAAAIVMTASLIKSTWFATPRTPPDLTLPVSEISRADWNEVISISERVHGDESDSIVVIVFTNFGCPACRAFDTRLTAALTPDVQVRLAHFPLAMHRFAKPAARAFECARIVGGAARFAATTFEKQDSLGIISWGELARRAEISDTLEIARCAMSPNPVDRISAGERLGERLGVSGTPTVFVNQRNLGSPSTAVLSKAIAGVDLQGSITTAVPRKVR